MFSLFKSKKPGKEKSGELFDLDHRPIREGDIVLSLRYDMGECRVLRTETGIEYESLSTGQRKSWIYMIDAATELQKVRKLDN